MYAAIHWPAPSTGSTMPPPSAVASVRCKATTGSGGPAQTTPAQELGPSERLGIGKRPKLWPRASRPRCPQSRQAERRRPAGHPPPCDIMRCGAIRAPRASNPAIRCVGCDRRFPPAAPAFGRWPAARSCPPALAACCGYRPGRLPRPGRRRWFARRSGLSLVTALTCASNGRMPDEVCTRRLNFRCAGGLRRSSMVAARGRAMFRAAVAPPPNREPIIEYPLGALLQPVAAISRSLGTARGAAVCCRFTVNCRSSRCHLIALPCSAGCCPPTVAIC